MSAPAPNAKKQNGTPAPAAAPAAASALAAAPTPAAAPATGSANGTKNGTAKPAANGTKNGTAKPAANGQKPPESAGNAQTNGNAKLTNAAAATAVLTAFSPETSLLSFKILAIFLVLAIVLFYFIQSNLLGRIMNKLTSAPSPSNNESIKNDQLKAIRPQVDDSAAKRKDVFTLIGDKIKEAFTTVKESFLSSSDLEKLPSMPNFENNTLLKSVQSGNLPAAPKLPDLGLNLFKAKPQPSPTTIGIASDKVPPTKERALLNFAVLGCRVAGYLGPRMNGVFAEADAIEAALKMGARLFIFDIDYLDIKPSQPVLVCRDENRNMLSNNTGSIEKAAASLVAFTRKQRAAGTDPILVVLNIQRLPGPEGNPKSRQALQFMSEVARQLAPMYPYLLKSTEEGDAQQQRLQDVLFKLPITRFENQIVLMTNADTSGFADADETFEPQRDLNILVNARIFSNSGGTLRNYSAPISSTPAAAVANTIKYYLEVPPQNYSSEVETTRNIWSMAMAPALDEAPTGEQLEVLVNKLGVQGIVVHPFPNVDGKFNMENEKKNMENAIYSKSFFGEYGYIPKLGSLRYKEPDAIVVPPADPKLNANGGLLVTPNVE
jgi:hypothetical protein